MRSQALRYGIYALSTGLGILSFLYPFLTPALSQNTTLSQARSSDAPLMYTLLLGLCLVVLMFEVQGQAVDTKLIALLGMLVAINSALRFIEIAIPGPGGFSPIFFLIILTGYVFGGRFGFLMGALTLFVSALVTGTVGPWLPSQMFAAGWLGMSAPLCRPVTRKFHAEGKTLEILILAIFGAFWGLLYGAIMNLWSWPFIAGAADQYWNQGDGIIAGLKSYALYYLVTSLVWDLVRALGNFLLIVALGAPTLRVLRRFHQRFSFNYQPVMQGNPGSGSQSEA